MVDWPGRSCVCDKIQLTASLPVPEALVTLTLELSLSIIVHTILARPPLSRLPQSSIPTPRIPSSSHEQTGNG